MISRVSRLNLIPLFACLVVGFDASSGRAVRHSLSLFCVEDKIKYIVLLSLL